MLFGNILPILLSLFLLQSENSIRLYEGGGPTLPDDEEDLPSDLAVVVFEVKIGADGSVIGNDLIQGPPEFVERSRLVFKDWKFTGVDPKLTPIYASAVFLYRPALEIPDAPMVFHQPLPDSFDQEHRSLFPVTVVDPGYPLSGFGEGNVILQVRTNAGGTVENVDVFSSVPPLSSVTAEAVRNWRFHVPKNGRPGELAIVVTVHRNPKYSH
jgi:hypothetical protein